MNLSPHPADRLIRHVVETGRPATDGEVEQIITRMAAAPFEGRDTSVPSELRGQRFQGQELGARGPALLVHVAQRVMLNQQWSDDTTEEAYLEDLRRAVRHPSARLILYERRGGCIAAAFAPNTMPVSRRGRHVLPWIYVVYSADRGMIVTGYQASSLQAVSIPEDARWLK